MFADLVSCKVQRHSTSSQESKSVKFSRAFREFRNMLKPRLLIPLASILILSACSTTRYTEADARAVQQSAQSCLDFNIARLDDGVSSADTVARAVASRCYSELLNRRTVLTDLQGGGLIYSQTFRQALENNEIPRITAQVFDYRQARRGN
jgi:hypothetical protein